MNAVRATWTNGKILPGEPVDWPEGSELVVEPVGTGGKVGLDEAEWRDDPAALADWDVWLRTVEPRVLTDDGARRSTPTRRRPGGTTWRPSGDKWRPGTGA